MRLSRWPLLSLLLALGILLPALAPVTAHQATHVGIDPTDMDLSVDPAQDFYRFANGGWLDRTEIPGDRPSYGVFDALDELTTQQLLDLIEGLAQSGQLREGSDEWKAVQLFQQGVDTEARNANGSDPIAPTIAEIDGIASKDDLHTFLQGSRFKGVQGLFTIDVFSDLADSNTWAAYLNGPQLWLPDRDYYLADDPSLDEVRTAYIDAMAKLLVYAGHDEATAHAAAEAVYELEKRLAAETLTVEEQQDLANINNPMSVAELEAQYPLMDWAAYMDDLGLPTDLDRILVTEPKYMKALDGIVNDTDLAVLKDMLTLQLLWTNRIYLDDDIQDISFNFRSRVLFGLTELPPIEERVLSDVNAELGEALGQLYVDAHFPPEAKAQITEMVDELTEAFRARIAANPWLSDAAKAEALAKLDNLIVKVGYPDQWRSYEEVEIADSYAGSIRSAENAEYRRMLARVGQPVDKTEWQLPPQTVNAYYDAADNAITFPAAILQAPFFDYRADAATNYGGIGIVIGHELTHGFDLQGSQFDAQGNLNRWWTDEDAARFKEINDRVVAQYSAIEVAPGLHVDGQRTVTEDVADMGGMQIAYDALELHLAQTGQAGSMATPVASPIASPVVIPVASPAASPVAFDIASLTPQQIFFISSATVWREEITPEYLATLTRSDEHAPSEIRATAAMRNMDAFYEAFDVQPGDAMYLAPEDRIVVW